jgi:hypothetical protein
MVFNKDFTKLNIEFLPNISLAENVSEQEMNIAVMK